MEQPTTGKCLLCFVLCSTVCQVVPRRLKKEGLRCVFWLKWLVSYLFDKPQVRFGNLFGGCELMKEGVECCAVVGPRRVA